MDLYWIARGSKITANEWFKRAPGRLVMWHVKDMQHFFVEQGGNFTHEPLRSIAEAYVKRMLLK
jgi:hypothetical protein